MTEEKQMPDWEALKEEIHGAIYRTHNGELRNIDEVVDSVMDCIRFPVRQSGDAIERVALAIGRTLYICSVEDWDDLMRGVLRYCAKAALAARGRTESPLVDALRFYAVTREEFAKEGKTGTEWQMRVYSDNGKVAREAIKACEIPVHESPVAHLSRSEIEGSEDYAQGFNDAVKEMKRCLDAAGVKYVD